MTDHLFDVDPAQVREPEPVEKLSPDRRRAQLQGYSLQLGFHPLSRALGGPSLALHAEAAPADDRDAPGRRCGNCAFRQLITYHNKPYPKCMHGAEDGASTGPRVTHGSGTDVRAWWPGCRDHEYKDGAQ